MPEDISVEPDWQGMFRYAVAIVETEIPVDRGQKLVKEMLEFGGRLENMSSGTPNQNQKGSLDFQLDTLSRNHVQSIWRATQPDGEIRERDRNETQ